MTGGTHHGPFGPNICFHELTVVRGLRPRWSHFLRADTMSQLYTYLEQNPGRRPERLHELSHGESFLEILRPRVNQ